MYTLDIYTYKLRQSVFRWLLVILTPTILMSCGKDAINISTPSYLRDNMAHKQADREGYIELPGTNVLFRSIHTKDSLFLDIMIDDNITRNSVLINGLSVWIDPEAGQNQAYGMTFVAARSEMLRRRDEFIKQLAQKDADTAAIILNATQTWVEAVNRRETVIKDKSGTRFAPENQTSVLLDKRNNLHYRMKFGMDQLGLAPGQDHRFSVGVVSNIHEVVPQSTQPQTMHRHPFASPRSWPQEPQPRPAVMPQIPINSWIIVTLGNLPGCNANNQEEPQTP